MEDTSSLVSFHSDNCGSEPVCLQCTKKDEKISELQKKISILQNQFDGAYKIVKQYNDSQKELEELKNQIKILKNENHDLEYRLKLSLQSVSEVESKVEKERKIAAEQRAIDKSQSEQRFEAQQSKYTTEIQCLYNQLQVAKQRLDENEIQAKTLYSHIDRMLHSASRYFNEDIKSIEDLSVVFTRTKQDQSSHSTEIRGIYSERESELKKKYKYQLRDANERADQLQEELNECKRKFKEVISEKERELDSLSNEMRDIKEKNDLERIQIEKDIAGYKSQVKFLKGEINKLQSIKVEKPKKSSSQQLDALLTEKPVLNEQKTPVTVREVMKIPECLQFELDTLREENTKLLNQNSELRAKNDENLSKLKQMETEKNEIVRKESKCADELKSIKTVYDETVNEVQYLRDALEKREKKLEEQDRKLRERKEKYCSLAKKANMYKTSLQSVEQEARESMLKVVKKDNDCENLNRKINELNDNIEDLNKQLLSSHDEISILKHKVLVNKSQSSADTLPPFAFQCNDCAPELSSEINKIATNTSLQPVTKVQSVLKVFMTYYSKLIAEREAALEESYIEITKMKDFVNKFFIDASVILFNQPMTFEDFFTRNQGVQFVAKLQSLVDELDSVTNLNREQEKVLSEFGRVFGPSNDKITQINRIQQDIEKLSTDNSKRRKTITQQKVIIKHFERELNNCKLDFENEKANIDSQSRDLIRRIQGFEEELASLRRENIDLREKVRVQKVQFERKGFTAEEEHKKEVEEIKEENEKFVAKLCKTVKQLQETIASNENKIGDANGVIDKLSKQIIQQKQQNDELIQQLEQVKSQHVLNMNNITEQHEEEKRNIRQTFETAAERLREQSEKHRNDAKKLSQEISDHEEANNKLKSDICDLKKQHKKDEKEIRSLQDELSRQKQLIEIQTKQQQTEMESECVQKIDKLKSKFDSEKRALFAVIADEFRQFFDPSERIDERSFRNVICKVSSEVRKLMRTDSNVRRLVSAAENQTTEEAVAQTLISRY